MTNLSKTNMKKFIFFAAAISAAILLSAQARADSSVPAQSIETVGSGTLTWTSGALVERMDIIAQPDPFSGNGYSDITLLALAKGNIKSARKEKREKNETKKTTDLISIAANGAYLIPFGDWKEMRKPGYGGMLELYFTDLFFEGFKAGIKTGYLYASGKAGGVKNEYMIPAVATFAYEIPVVWEIAIVPRVSGGGAYFNLSYKPVTAGKSEEKKAEFEPLAKAGISLICNITEYITIEAGAEYGMVFEKDGRLPFMLSRLGCSINF